MLESGVITIFVMVLRVQRWKSTVLLETIRYGKIRFSYRSFSHDNAAAIFVYKTINRWPCLCTKTINVGIELFSHVKTFFYSKQFAKLLTT